MRWDKFIEGMTQGYGTGYARGRQYIADERQRDIDAATSEISGALAGETPTQGALTIEEPAAAPQMSPVATPDPAGALDMGGPAPAPQMSPAAPQADALAAPTETRVNLQGSVTGPQTRDQFAKLRDAMRRKLELEGNTEGLLTLDDRLNQYRQGKIVENLNQAAQLIERDPEAAAQYLHNAYGYYPDGKQAMFTMRDGKLVGYGFDEKTNKFSDQMEINADSITAIAEQVADPQAFKNRVAAENLAAERAAYEQFKDQRDFDLKQRQFQLDVFDSGVAAETAEYDRLAKWAKAHKDYFDREYSFPGGGSGGSNVKQMKDFQSIMDKSVSYLTDQIDNTRLTDDQMRVLGDEGLLGSGFKTAGALMGDIVYANMMGGNRPLSSKEVVDKALDVMTIDQFYQGKQGLDATDDRANEALVAEMQKRTGGQPPVLTDDGMIRMTLDGQPVMLNAVSVPGLAAFAMSQKLGSSAEQPTEATGAVQAEFDDPMLQDSPDAGERLSEAGGAITDFVSRNIVEPVARFGRQADANQIMFEYNKSMQNGGQPRLSRESIESLEDYSAAEMRELGLPDDVIELVGRFQNYQRGSNTSLGGTAQGAIPGV